MNDFQYNEGHQERNATNEHVRTSGLAVASLVLSILGIHLLGLIFGIIALKKIKRSGGSLTGGGLALAGIIISSVGLLIVIVFVSLAAFVAATQFTGQIDKARVTTTKASLRSLHAAVLQFRMDTGRYPEEAEGLDALIEKPEGVDYWQPGGYLDTTELPKDAWEREFIYDLNPEDGKPFVIISFGADGEEGGEGFDMDLLSTSRY